ncbi:unnamed protein product [Meganyctiphanes norvegica]|uniref:Uncharacterized protein n=1 Tax=Meganyctiphanes norvegica TaxID=48144 RepID=A0AAV2QM85_MEGNR
MVTSATAAVIIANMYTRLYHYLLAMCRGMRTRDFRHSRSRSDEIMDILTLARFWATLPFKMGRLLITHGIMGSHLAKHFGLPPVRRSIHGHACIVIIHGKICT